MSCERPLGKLFHLPTTSNATLMMDNLRSRMEDDVKRCQVSRLKLAGRGRHTRRRSVSTLREGQCKLANGGRKQENEQSGGRQLAFGLRLNLDLQQHRADLAHVPHITLDSFGGDVDSKPERSTE